jgi:hypothetical protein
VLKLSLALAILFLGLVLPAAYAVSVRARPRTIEQTLLRQMNSYGDGTVTRRVRCRREGTVRPSFACTLESVRSTTLQARVEVVDGGLRTIWYPLEG